MKIAGTGCFIDALVPIFSSYLRAFDKTKFTLISAATGNVINMSLDALFIFGLKWGVIGAYIGLTIDECVRGLIIVIRWKKGKWEQKVLVQSPESNSENKEAQTSKLFVNSLFVDNFYPIRGTSVAPNTL